MCALSSHAVERAALTRPRCAAKRCSASCRVAARAVTRCQADTPAAPCSRRAALAAGAALGAVLLRPERALARPAFEAGDGADVTAYLPDSPDVPGFVSFRPTADKTPALRSGTIDPTAPYTFSLPKDKRWKESKVANAISGNYCQPRCDEPTTEVIFTSPLQGKVSVIISPLIKVTRLVNPQVNDVGPPEKLIESFGPYITGDTIDVSNDVVSAKSATVDGQVYYTYELFTPTALSGAHNVAALTFKGGVSVLCVASASDKQWDAAQEDLRKVVASFRIGQKA